MSLCRLCGDKGIVLVCYVVDRAYDALSCLCKRGEYFRQPKAMRAWAAGQKPPPGQVKRIEEHYSAKDLEILRTATDLDQDTGGPPTSAEFDEHLANWR